MLGTEKLMSLKVKLSAHCNKSEFRTFTRAWPNFLSNIQRSKNCVELHALKHHNTKSINQQEGTFASGKIQTDTKLTWTGIMDLDISVAEKSSHSITESILACVHPAPWHAMAYGGKMWRGHKRRVRRQLATTVSVIDVFSFNLSIVGIVW